MWVYSTITVQNKYTVPTPPTLNHIKKRSPHFPYLSLSRSLSLFETLKPQFFFSNFPNPNSFILEFPSLSAQFALALLVTHVSISKKASCIISIFLGFCWSSDFLCTCSFSNFFCVIGFLNFDPLMHSLCSFVLWLFLIQKKKVGFVV